VGPIGWFESVHMSSSGEGMGVGRDGSWGREWQHMEG